MNQYYPLTEEEVKLAEKLARKYTSNYHWKTVEFDDAFSNLKLWLMENLDIVIKCRDTTEFAEYNNGYLFTSLRNEVIKFCRKETRSKVYADLEDNNFYTVKKVANILKEVLAIDFIKFEMEVDSKSVAYEIGADVLSAFYGLSSEEKELLALRFRFGYSGVALAEKLEVDENAASQRVHRALEKLVSKLSGEPSFWTSSPKYKYKEI
jgi:RNA polymerase sigma factor (sigma-70 family)